jgi:hypothetical protein
MLLLVIVGGRALAYVARIALSFWVLLPRHRLMDDDDRQRRPLFFAVSL